MKKITIEEFNKNVFTALDKEWALVACKDGDRFNAMTVSWGGLGVLWNKKVATIYIRPQRYTRELLDNQDYFTLNFFDDEYHKTLAFYGANSGKDVNKEEATGLHPVVDDQYGYLQEANLVMKCKKIYKGEIKPENILDETIDAKNYPSKDYHYVYIGEIESIEVK